MTPSEQLTFDLCEASFLSLWSYANPLRPNGKEFCDVLAVFGDNVVLFSVKDIAVSTNAEPDVAARRWTRKAIDESLKQLRGAKRQLDAMSHVIRADGTAGIDFPANSMRRTYLVAVAAGAERTIPFAGGMMGDDQYVHVLDEFALKEIMRELNTAADFLHYLDAKERFTGTVVCEGEENLLAVYLHRGRKFPEEQLLLVQEGLWDELQRKPEFAARMAADKISVWWDDLIGILTDVYSVRPERGATLSDHERLVRTLASENRFARRLLSESCVEWLHRREAGARNLISPSDVAYIFATYPRDWSREARTDQLGARCLVARSPSMTGKTTVVGLATEIYDPSGFSFDAVYLHLPQWSEANEQLAQEARAEYGIMETPTYSCSTVDEFPDRARRERNRRKRARKERRKSRRDR